MMRLTPLVIMLSLLFFSNHLLAEDEEAEAEVEPKTAAYHALSPSLLVNLHTGARYMRCDVQLLSKDDTNLSDIQLHSPALRHELLLLFGDQKGSEMKTPEGKEALRKTALKAVNEVLEKLSGKKELVNDLFFTSFFVQ
ncbi:MAG: flagellar basal body-associated FliL family protein [Candidatus Sedimenticola sp. (ex Thyasira tokunagai)]